MINNLTNVVLAMIFLLSSCQTAKITPSPGGDLKLPDLPEEDGKSWLEIDPKQCGSNPWEKDWEQIDITLPTRCQTQCAQVDKQEGVDCQTKCLVQEYYSRKGIEILDVKAISYAEKFGKYISICEACDCPGGETLYIQVPILDTNGMIEMGFRLIVRSCDTATPQPYGCGIR
jgi:hypothetical protein